MSFLADMYGLRAEIRVLPCSSAGEGHACGFFAVVGWMRVGVIDLEVSALAIRNHRGSGSIAIGIRPPRQ